ncbi:Neutral ceramidase [Ceratocystis platani]|uniref:Neutral ceramidase n=1 Tax=Ceratocystis fimbriata f. sp. platani TaxID=88771 RepID=A0A0F8BLZ1_CERFI|nr:Neutral ceramidase [Ceratocystis platani]
MLSWLHVISPLMASSLLGHPLGDGSNSSQVQVQVQLQLQPQPQPQPKPQHTENGQTRGRNIFLAGAGKADITGPVVELNMMGYADSSQIGTGLRQRLYSRAFIVGETHNPSARVVYLVLDTHSGDTAVRNGIIEGLHALGSPYTELYGSQNIAVTGTHSHSGPGGWHNYLLPQITSFGFDKQSYQAIVTGAVLSIKRAHDSIEPARLGFGSTKLQDASINRSLFSYLANPEEERAQYNKTGKGTDHKFTSGTQDDGSVETDLKLLRFSRVSDNKTMGVLTWFPTHGTSMLANNTLISGDNKGVAAALLEKKLRQDAPDSITESFVAGFSQAHVGDVSPNILGAWCEDGSGSRCSPVNSTCSDGRAGSCHARGPRFRVADNGASSCYEIGRRQYAAARKLTMAPLDDEAPDVLRPITGGGTVRAFHAFHDMSNFEFISPDEPERVKRTCPAALGYSFAAGTSDGPGGLDFTQNDHSGANKSAAWKVISSLIKIPGAEQVACQAPKPLLLDVGEVVRPYLWTPNIVDIQVLRIGNLMVVVSPGEASTMAGRRWMRAVEKEARHALESTPDITNVEVVLGGPANTYTHYISTPEEYALQRYEGASTLYGPHTLAAYINRTLEYLPLLFDTVRTPLAAAAEIGPLPPDTRNASLHFVAGVVFDSHPFFTAFGDVISDVAPSSVYYAGDTVQATFVGANPRNNLRLEGTFAAVESMISPGVWKTVRDDSDWDLVYNWKRTSSIRGTSKVTLQWHLPDDVERGCYRLRYFGDAKSLSGGITSFSGTSSEFYVM